MKQYEIRDIALAPSGHQKIQWVKNNMPLLAGLEEEFKKTKPFEGIKVSLSVHLEAKTAYLCLVLAAGGAQLSVTGSNSLSTQDDIAAALADGKVRRYMTDFPNPKTCHMENVIATPHLGASTAESEDNCAVMAVEELREFMDTGQIRHAHSSGASEQFG